MLAPGSSSAIATAGHPDAAVRFARRAEIPLLVDLTRLTDDAGSPLGSRRLIDMVRHSGAPDSDVRVLADDAHVCGAALQELSDELGCDVYLVGSDATLDEVSGEIVATSRATGEPADWLLIRPGHVPPDAPTWFECASGRVRVRAGLVTLGLATGVAFANRQTFLEMITFAAATPVPPAGITPLAVHVHSGCFRIGWYTGAEAVLGGADMARLLAASLADIGPDVQVALNWPLAQYDRDRLQEELQLMANALDRAVWVPDPGHAAANPPPLGELTSADAGGGFAPWTAYHPHGRPSQAPECQDDLEPNHRRIMRQADVAFRALRFGVPAEAETLCRAAEAWATYLEEYERVTQAAPWDAGELDGLLELQLQLGQLVDASGFAVSRGAEDDAFPRLPAEPHGPSSASVARAPTSSAGRLSPGAAAPARSLTNEAPRGRPAHRISWLPRSPIANATAQTLYCWIPGSPDRLSTEGIRIADGFVLGRLQPNARGFRPSSGCLLRLEVEPGTAIRLREYAGNLPASLQHRANEAADVFLIPATWLSLVTVSEWYPIDRDGTLGGPWVPEHPGIVVSFHGAEHGVPGLPNGAVRWPERRKHASAVLTLPDDPEWIQSRLEAYPGWLPLQRRAAAVAHGYRTFDVDLPRRAAIDVPATLAAYARAPIAPSSLAGFTGVDLVLPSRFFSRTTITEVREPAGRRRPISHPLIGLPLTRALPAGVWNDAPAPDVGAA